MKSVKVDIYRRFKLGPGNKLLILLIIPMGVMYPSLFSIFSLLGIQKGSIENDGPIIILFQISTMIAYVYLLSMLGHRKMKRLTSLWLSIIIAIIYIYSTSIRGASVSRWNFLWAGIPTAFILIASFPQYKKRIITYALSLIPFSIFMGSFIKFAIANVSIGGFFSVFVKASMLDAYFGGLNGVTEGLNYLRSNSFTSTLYCTMTDIFGNMPVLSRYFDAPNMSTEAIYLNAIGRTDLICPLLAQSTIHFGIIGAPVLSVVMAIIALESELASVKAYNVYTLYALKMLCVIFSLFMCLNTTIMLPKLWLILIFLLLQYCFRKM